jgi:hypothetical protein
MTAPSTVSPGSSQRRRPKHDNPGLKTTASPQARRSQARDDGIASNTTSPSTTLWGSRQWCRLKHDPGLKTTPLSHVRRPLAQPCRAQDNGVTPNTTPTLIRLHCPEHDCPKPRTMAPSTMSLGSRRRRCPKHNCPNLKQLRRPKYDVP